MIGIQNLCLDLMCADSEEAVITLLTEAGYWSDSPAWRFLGDHEGNYATVGNQQSRAEAAIVEKLINSVDARLTNACLEAGIDPTSPGAPQSIRKAVAAFFDDGMTGATAGRIHEWVDTKRTAEAKLITIAASGHKPEAGNACISIADQGEGQSPDAFPSTFMSLHHKNKIRIPFVQGKFNMGSTGALEFCGRHGLQLIVARRNPALLDGSPAARDSEWGFTVLRREDPSGGRRISVYSYLAPVGSDTNPGRGAVLSFKADTMPIFPDGQKTYARPAPWGTLVKLYEYEMRGFSSNVISTRNGLLRRLDLLLPEVALPIRIYETRKYKGKKGSFETNIAGLGVRLSDDRGENLEVGYPTSATVSVAGEPMDITIHAFKKGAALTYKLPSEGILFTVNGQTHASISTDFFRRQSVALSYLRDSLLVIVDCTNTSGRAREVLFMASRDRLRDNQLKYDIEAQLELLLRNHEGLRELVNQRRREAIEARLEDSKTLQEVLESLLNRSPILQSLLLQGKQVRNPFAPKLTAQDDEAFEGKSHPSVFKFKGLPYGEVLRRDAFVGQRVRITFETDVENGYFSREIDKGAFVLKVADGEGYRQLSDHSLNLINGIATLNAPLPADVAPGDQIEWHTQVHDDTLIEPFVNVVLLDIRSPRGPSDSAGGTRRKPPKKGKGDDRETPSFLALPDIIPVSEEQWNDEDPPFDRYTAVRITHAGSEEDGERRDSYDFKVNVDNIYLKSEQKQRTQPPELVKAQFVQGLVLVSLAVLQEHKKVEGALVSADDSSSVNVEDLVEMLTRAVAPVLLPMLESLGTLEVDE